MGKTVESSRMALEEEIKRWSCFARALRKPDREAFDELMDTCRSYASESSYATNPIIFEPMIISILLFQQRRIRQLERELQAIKPDTPPPSESQQTMRADQAQPKTSIPTATKGGEQLRLEVSKR